jgi:hypothetical protein
VGLGGTSANPPGAGPALPADTDVQAPVDELLVLLGHADLDLVDDQVGVAGLDLVQDLRHRVVAGVDDADPECGRHADRAAGGPGRPVHMGEDLPDLGQEHRPGRGQSDGVGAAVQQPDPQLTLQPLNLLTQRRLHDVLAGRRTAEVQFLGQRHEVAKLAQLHASPPPAGDTAARTTTCPVHSLSSLGRHTPLRTLKVAKVIQRRNPPSPAKERRICP